ncbi:acyltransferase [Pseudoalteromonas sp. ACER1]|uniref:acyltransferase family protein n=1 Tax=Pseudoalteromonas sp. ACER1 TaxID=2954495 RepID=UPI002097036F|nr:acyltransferase [Pseudoalteromonas sp. ACER1]MCO7209696.1 acyltransferase [Pseudoalteromonas sp. ACER1]
MYVSIQYLRAIAAFMVLLSHAAFKLETYGSDMMEWYRIGSYGVDLFFIISGFIMCLTIEKKRQSFIVFMKKRIIRIIPLYWALTSVALVIYIAMPEAVNSSGGHTSILSSYFLIPDGSKYLINNGWTLSYEFYFYFIFSMCFVFPHLQKQITCIILALLFLIGALVNFDGQLFSFFTNNILLEFALGILAYYLLKAHPLNVFLSSTSFTLGCLGLIFVNIYGEVNSIFGRSFNGGIPMFLIFIGFVSLESKLKFNSPLYQMGMSSYSLYLLHPFILAAVTIAFRKLALIDYSNLYLITMLIVSVLSGWLCYIFLEKCLDEVIRKKLYGKQVILNI